MTVPADTADPVSNAVTSPEASLFLRQTLQAALANPGSASASWVPQAQVLLANVLMNDVLNSWNPDHPVDVNVAQNKVNQAIAANPSSAVLALAHHAQGLIHRATGNQDRAQTAFENAVQLEPGFARAHAQIGNQEILRGNAANAHQHVNEAIRLSPRNPAYSYFYWARGRAYVEQGQWKDAVDSLEESLSWMTTVWYVYAYMAYALLQDHKRREAEDILTRLNNGPIFQAKLEQIKASQKEDPARPGAKVRNLLRDWLSTGKLPP